MVPQLQGTPTQLPGPGLDFSFGVGGTTLGFLMMGQSMIQHPVPGRGFHWEGCRLQGLGQQVLWPMTN